MGGLSKAKVACRKFLWDLKVYIYIYLSAVK